MGRYGDGYGYGPITLNVRGMGTFVWSKLNSRTIMRGLRDIPLGVSEIS